MSETNSKIDVRFSSNAFYLSTAAATGELKISTPLALDRGSEGLKFEVIPLLRANLHENSIRQVFMAGADRIGWIIPGNALSSDEHDYGTNPHFLKYAYETTREILEGHQEVISSEIERLQELGVEEATLADLLHDNVCFLTISIQRVPEDCPLEGLMPSLISEGFIPYGSSDPDSITWSSSRDLPDTLTLKLIGDGVGQPDVPIRMMTIAATAAHSPATQFFYLYQVIELLLEGVLHMSMKSIGTEIGRAIRTDEFQTLRDRLADFKEVMSERKRLMILMESCAGSGSAIVGLEVAAKDFLHAVGVTPKGGISCLYQVRNFVVHQIRSMPDESEILLTLVVHEFATFLSSLLATFKVETSEHVG